MFLNSLRLTNFRNYKDLNLELDRDNIMLVGDNGQGKSNFIEAINFLAFAKSTRAFKNTDLIKWDDEDSYINTVITKKDVTINVDFRIGKNGRVFLKVDGNYKKRLSDFLGTINVVFFETKDLNLIKGNSTDRKKYLDKILIQLSPKYYSNVQIYNKALRQRNSILKKCQSKGNVQYAEIEIWNEQLIKTGSVICSQRYNLLQKLKNFVFKSHKDLSGGDETLQIEYVSKLLPENGDVVTEENIKENFASLLKQYSSKEMYAGQTLVGPHKDDFAMYLKNRNAKVYASQGQQRTIAFALKLGEYQFIEHEIDDKPILLLDDILSELDPNRQEQLLMSLNNVGQTFITTTYIPQFFFPWIKNADVLRVTNGTIDKHIGIENSDKN